MSNVNYVTYGIMLIVCGSIIVGLGVALIVMTGMQPK